MSREEAFLSPLFEGMTKEEITGILKCLSAVDRNYEKGDMILRMGEPISTMGLVVTGMVQIARDDFWGNRQVLSVAGPGQLFGESYACLPGEPLMVMALAVEKTEVLFLDVNRILTVCSPVCSFHSRLIRNLLSILAGKNLMLTRKIDHMGQRTIREKVIAYLSFQAKRQKNRSFQIPYSRQELADYLAVDRSALSAELSKMQRDGIISYKRNKFTIGKNVKIV